MAEQNQDRTEAATPRRRQEAREQGNVARSIDLSAAVALLGAVILLNIYGQSFIEGMKLMLEHSIHELSTDLHQPRSVSEEIYRSLWMAVSVSAPLMLGLAVLSIVVGVAQVGLLFTTKPLEPNLAKLSPLKGLHGLFEARAGIRLLMSLLKLAMVVALAMMLIVADIPAIIGMAELEPWSMFVVACGMVYQLAIKIALALLVLAMIDYAFQRWQHERDLRMTKEEIKEEMKRMEGDPVTKQRRTRIARQMALQRINQAVPKAQVVVTNPTHFAVALQYDSATMKAPKVVAKGADFLAMRIRQLAVMHEVPLVERKELARALYREVEIGQEIPGQYYHAVAEILAYVYRLAGRKIA